MRNVLPLYRLIWINNHWAFTALIMDALQVFKNMVHALIQVITQSSPRVGEQYPYKRKHLLKILLKCELTFTCEMFFSFDISYQG